MECPFHAGSEAITSCAQCDTPICPLCASETNQVLLCLNCYRSRVEELSVALSSTPVRLAKERKKEKARMFSKRVKAATAVEVPPAEVEAAEVAAAPAEVPLSKKELARLRKEEAKRLKMEKKLARRAKRAKAEVEAEVEAEAAEVAAAPAEPAPFIQPPEEPPPPAQEAKPEPSPGPLPDITFEFPLEPEKEGVKLPRLEDRLEFLPPLEEKEEELPPGLEPPEGFFD
ncbi:MAG: hypothetical protein QME89_04375 [Actinomycetota bacterium]|nr:hypothetical protein [Actinomycetota bacterium]